MAVCFVDIVGYTTHSKSLDEDALVAWIEGFEQDATGTVVDHGGRVIKTIGDEILFTADDPAAAAEIALALTERGLDEDDPFPAVRAGIAYGLVVNRLGDVFGPTVNIAARLTSVARPGTVVLDRGVRRAVARRGSRRRRDDPPRRTTRRRRGRADTDAPLPLPAPAPGLGQGLRPARGVAAEAARGRRGRRASSRSLADAAPASAASARTARDEARRPRGRCDESGPDGRAVGEPIDCRARR